MVATVIVGIILAVIVFCAIRSIIKRRKGGCGCGCEGCSGCTKSAIKGQ
ncbi:MAG: FeoB-associated Cys-rich membrane protein [Clostridia bacterium]|nr:FeoB-associated Cys-rich membrane protein [Clostridia bacterium]